jgi:hypothetical protein
MEEEKPRFGDDYQSCWYSGECHLCGKPHATNGRFVWCTNDNCRLKEARKIE